MSEAPPSVHAADIGLNQKTVRTQFPDLGQDCFACGFVLVVVHAYPSSFLGKLQRNATAAGLGQGY